MQTVVFLASGLEAGVGMTGPLLSLSPEGGTRAPDRSMPSAPLGDHPCLAFNLQGEQDVTPSWTVDSE